MNNDTDRYFWKLLKLNNDTLVFKIFLKTVEKKNKLNNDTEKIKKYKEEEKKI